MWYLHEEIVGTYWVRSDLSECNWEGRPRVGLVSRITLRAKQCSTLVSPILSETRIFYFKLNSGDIFNLFISRKGLKQFNKIV